MYIFELFIKWLNKNNRGEGANPDNIFKGEYYNNINEAEACEHNFMPIDSTGNILSCTKCGFVIKKNENLRG